MNDRFILAFLALLAAIALRICAARSLEDLQPTLDPETHLRLRYSSSQGFETVEPEERVRKF